MLAIIVLALNRGQRYHDIEVAAADTGKDYQIIYDTGHGASKGEALAHFQLLLQKYANDIDRRA